MCYSKETATDQQEPLSQKRATAEQVEYFEKHVRPILASRCYECHSGKAKKLQAGFRLDSRAAMLKGGESGPAIVPGDPGESLLVASIRYESFEMPPKGKLNEREIAAISKWIKMGAPWPELKGSESKGVGPLVPEHAEYDWKKLRANHWSFRPISKTGPPKVKNLSWVRTPIDRFILARLEQSGLKPAPPAKKRTLIRRTYFDLIGLPPTPKEVEAFVKDDRADAFSRLVDRLLDSPQYGERWGRHWLDVARYSDGFGGFLDNAALPHAWQYRDWVIEATNADMPYDRFVKNQIAGDLIADGDGPLGTGFFAIGPTYKSDGGDPDAVAQAKSETLDDRVDTFSRAFLGLTVSCARCHDHKFDPIPQLDYYSLAGVFNNSKGVVKPVISRLAIERHQKVQQEILQLERRIKLETSEPKKDELVTLLVSLKKIPAPKPSNAHVLAESGSADMKLAIRGNLRRPGPVAPRRILRILAGEEPPRFTKGSGRLELADAVADNPLTARVIVNRVWLHHFGSALVRTPSNFGALGEKPSHPELLDWLATHLIKSGWSLKTLHRTIMRSAAYQMSSQFNQRNFATDGDNRLLWRMNPRKMDVETWRDSLLTVTGQLDRQLGGAPIESILKSHRRTLYAKVSRNGDRFAADAFLRLFDFPTPRATTPQRTTSIVPQQYLFMMNSAFMIERAKVLAERVAKERDNDPRRIDRAYSLLFGRTPTEPEKRLGLAFLKSNGQANKSDLSPWQRYAQVLLSANEFIYIR